MLRSPRSAYRRCWCWRCSRLDCCISGGWSAASPTSSKAPTSSRRHLPAIFALLTFGLLVLHPVFDAQFVLVDDHEILSLTAPQGSPRSSAPRLDVRGMAFESDPSVGRFRPLY